MKGFIEIGRTTDDRENKLKKITQWLDKQPEIDSYTIGKQVDTWYGPFDEI